MQDTTRQGPNAQVRYHDHLDVEDRTVSFGWDDEDGDYCLLKIEDAGGVIARLRLSPEGFSAIRAALALAELAPGTCIA